ncbi:MAG: hypothetical protein AAGI14_07665 [Pseudomonadota bacterium]
MRILLYIFICIFTASSASSQVADWSKFEIKAQSIALSCAQDRPVISIPDGRSGFREDPVSRALYCSLKRQTLESAFKALNDPTYDDIAAYHFNTGLIEVLRAGDITQNEPENGDVACRATTAAHRAFEAMPENTRAFKDAPDIVSSVEDESQQCIRKFKPFTPPLRMGGMSIRDELLWVAEPCMTAYDDFNSNYREPCEKAHKSLLQTSTATTFVTPKAKSELYLYRTIAGVAYAEALYEEALETNSPIDISCTIQEQRWAQLRQINRTLLHPIDAKRFDQQVEEFIFALPECRTETNVLATAALTLAPLPLDPLKDLAGISRKAVERCNIISQSKNTNFRIGICENQLEQIKASRSAQIAINPDDLIVYWHALAKVRNILAEAYAAHDFDRLPSARSCMQTELSADAIETLLLSPAASTVSDLKRLTAKVRPRLEACRRDFITPQWGAYLP